MPDGATPAAAGPAARRLGLARVHGRSMEPTLRQGDRLLVLHGGAPRPGRLVVVRLGGPGGVVAVKRAAWQEPEGWWVERDNPHEGVDSWSAGAVPPGDVLAVVLARVWPPRASRRGRLGRLRRGAWCRLRHIRSRGLRHR